MARLGRAQPFKPLIRKFRIVGTPAPPVSRNTFVMQAENRVRVKIKRHTLVQPFVIQPIIIPADNLIISPAYKYEGDDPFTMTLTGAAFTGSSAVSVNGVARATTLVSATTLTVAVLAADLAAIGVFAVTVSGAGTTGPSYLTVYARLQPQGGRGPVGRPKFDHLADSRPDSAIAGIRGLMAGTRRLRL